MSFSLPTWKSNIGNSSVLSKTIVDGSIDISGTFYNRVANVIIGNPDDNYSSTFGNINCNQVQTQTFKNESSHIKISNDRFIISCLRLRKSIDSSAILRSRII